MNSKSMRRKILIVDDHPMLREGLAQVIKQQPDLEVCCQAADAREALGRLAKGKADLAIVDLSLEGKSGLELIKDLRALQPDLPALVVSMHDESVYAERALRAGARGYVMKKAGGEALLAAIRTVLAGKVYVSADVASHLIGTVGGWDARKRLSVDSLTDREFEVLTLIGEGMGGKDIAARLGISLKTVDVYRQRVREKLHLEDSTALIQHAVRWVESERLESGGASATRRHQRRTPHKGNS